MVYFQVDDVDAAAPKAKSMCANPYLPPMAMEGAGPESVTAGPKGVLFAIFKSAR